MSHIRVMSVVTLLIILSTTPARAERAEVKAAKAAVTAWLALVDAGKYDKSWQEAASFFRKAVPKATWRRQVGAVRGPLGAVVSRKPKSATFTTSLPGAPDGKYVVIQLETRFKNKRSAVETITPTLDRDGKWRVAGYFIK